MKPKLFTYLKYIQSLDRQKVYEKRIYELDKHTLIRI